MQTYFFYDIETTGLSKAFDQILHFAAIRTDLSLKEIERYEVKVKLNPDVIPAPAALLTHHMGLKEISEGISEFDAIRQIHQWINTPGTISLGYNTLGFDDEFLRFSFYRNLLPPYTHQYANDCGRMDLYPMAVMYFLYKNHVINWPEKLKLEQINAANQFVTGRSHHAMIDVEVTLALAKRFFQEQDMWQHLAGYFKKQEDEKRSRSLQNTTALMVLGKLGGEQRFQCPVIFIGDRSHYRQQLWLRLDTETFSEKNYAIYKKKCGEPPFILPERFLRQIDPERLARIEENKNWLKTRTDIYHEIVKYQTEYRYPIFPKTDANASLYLNGFWSSEEEKFCRAFHKAAAKEKSRLTDQVKNSTLKTLAIRILGRHYPEAMSLSQAELFSAYMRSVDPSNEEDALIDYQGNKRLTPRAALNEIMDRRGKPLEAEESALLQELENHLKS